jgi:hypothetical protein
MMNPKRAVAAILVAILVICGLVFYSLQTRPAQALLCTATHYFVPDTATATKAGEPPIVTSTLVNGNSTTIVIDEAGHNTYIASSVYTTATNATNSAGHVVTSTSTNYGASPSGAWTEMTCTYLP